MFPELEEKVENSDILFDCFLNDVAEYAVIGGWYGLKEWESAREDIWSDILSERFQY